MSPLYFKATSRDAGERLDVYLTKVLPGDVSRSQVRRWIEARLVRVCELPCKPAQKLAEGDDVWVDLPRGRRQNDGCVTAERIPLDIFYEDSHLLVVNKASGMVVHPAAGNRTGTLVNALLAHCDSLSDVNAVERPGIVHRLDAETSGLLVVAKDNITHAHLARQFQQKKVEKKYLAFVEGRVEFDQGMIDAPIARHPRRREKKTVSHGPNARAAQTKYSVIRRESNRTLVALYPLTGRTHQLRVHMRHLGHPILGDSKYGHSGSFFRLALHAQSLGFVHPRTRSRIEFSTPVPDFFCQKEGI